MKKPFGSFSDTCYFEVIFIESKRVKNKSQSIFIEHAICRVLPFLTICRITSKIDE